MLKKDVAKDLHLNVFMLCEDAREEINGKYALTGIFAGDEIKIASFPANIRLAAYLDFVFTRKVNVKSKTQFSLDGATLLQAEADLTAPASTGHMVLLLPTFYLPIPKPGQLEVSIQTDDGPWLVINKRNLVQAEQQQG